MDVYCGIDWAEEPSGHRPGGPGRAAAGRRRISDDAAGLAACLRATRAAGLPGQPDRRRQLPRAQLILFSD
jgi:hypothetical protein